MKWNVYYYDINKNKISTFNIIDHWSFREYTKKAAKKLKTKEEFAEQLDRELRYYFWSRAEYELIIELDDNNNVFLSPWVGCRNPEEVKIDVTEDENLNWIKFAEEHTAKQIYGNKAKIDVYDQVMFIWDEFLDYMWDNRKEILKYGISHTKSHT